ncbi:MAG: (Fe-S)-binding protein [Deltaproteobacteria bacterium]|nr:(Fe-S)-binding protein [Deltaproteobacteria bacterium]
MEQTSTQTGDQGLEKSVARLTPDQIAKTLGEILKSEGGARLKAYVKTCMSCGLCADACHFYLSHENDPRFSPAGKVKQTIAPLLKKKGAVDPEFIKRAALVAFTQCNLCKRCVMYCPFGVDVAWLMLFVRRLCSRLGVVPQYIQDTAHSHSVTKNQMWVKEDEWIDTVFWQEEEAAEEVPGLTIPLEREGADIMYSVIAPEPKFRAQLIYQAAVMFHAAGVSWTMPATPGWDNSDMAMYTGENEIMGRLKRAHFEAAMRLRVKRIVMGECGHALRSVHDMGNRWLGWKTPPVPVTHAIEFYWELLESGKIRVAKKLKTPVTLHDPCNVARGLGLHEKARDVMAALCEDFVEMHPNREYNICCGAGGGVINCGPPHKAERLAASSAKAKQLFDARTRGARTIIAPCHNCHGGLEDIVEHHHLGMDLKFLGDVIYECMEKPWKKDEEEQGR